MFFLYRSSDTPKKKPDMKETGITETPKTGGVASTDHAISQLAKGEESPASSTDDMPTNGDGDAARAPSGGDGSMEEAGGAVGGSSGGMGITIGELVSDINLPSEEVS